MTPERFCDWLQGAAELSIDAAPTPAQWKTIKDHLALCFDKVTPEMEPASMEPPAFVSETGKDAFMRHVRLMLKIEEPDDPGYDPERDGPLIARYFSPREPDSEMLGRIRRRRGVGRSFC